MENENEGGGLGTIPEFEETKDEEENDTTNWKEIALAQNEAAKKFYGVAKRNFKDLEKLKKTSKENEIQKPDPEKPVKEGFDYGELAYLESKQIQEDEQDFVFETMKDSGKSLKDLLSTKWFQSELKEKREAKAVKDAIPSGTKRSVSPANNTVEYWLAKGELPPKEQSELRRQVLNEEIKRAGNQNKFTDRPVI